MRKLKDRIYEVGGIDWDAKMFDGLIPLPEGTSYNAYLVQGSEKTAIVLSLVRSNAEGDIGFLGRPQDGPRRLNVALTRAKRYCAVVGDFHTLRYDSDGKSTELYQNFRDFFATTGRLRDVDPDFIPV